MSEEDTVEMFVGGLVLDPGTQAPIVVLKDESGKVALPIWIGISEATSIATILKKLNLARPMTHDLMFNAVNEMGGKIQRVVITDLRDATYFAELIVSVGERAFTLDSRPSDAIALALRASAPIFVARHVLEQARVPFELGEGGNIESPEDIGPQSAEETSGAVGEEGSVEAELVEAEKDFKHIDKNKWSEILADLDPDDFKYKM